MMEAQTLKPCPFCGGDAEMSRCGTAQTSMIICCLDCGAYLESVDIVGVTPPECYAWNTRAVNAQLHEENERLREENAKLSARYGVYATRTDKEIE